MAVVALTQARSSGATTAALALARVWPRPVVLVEADLAGGDLAARYGIATSPGLVDLAATPGSQPAGLRSVAQNLGGIEVVAAPVSAEVTRAALDALGPDKQWVGTVEDGDVLVDCGRLQVPPTPISPLLESAAVAVFLVRPTAPSVVSLRQRLTTLPESLRNRSVVVLVGDRPYGADEVGATLGIPVVGVLADDPVAAAAFGATEPVQMSRSALLRTAAVVAGELVCRCTAPSDQPAPSPARAGRWSTVTPRFSFSQNGSR
jgi:hypothetical protein